MLWKPVTALAVKGHSLLVTPILSKSLQILFRARLEKQYEQKARKAVENARIQWEKQQQQEISKSNEDAVKRQQELRENERRENLSTRENMKHELASVKKEYAMVIEKLKREIAEEKKKSQYNMKRRDSRDNAAQVISMR